MSNTKGFREATADELETLAQFARLQVSLEELRGRLVGMLEFDFGSREAAKEVGEQSSTRFERIIDPKGRTLPGSAAQKLYDAAGDLVAERRLTSYFLLPEPGVRIERWHIENALNKLRRREITEQQLSDWAAMLLLNEAYDWEGPDEDFIADQLNELALARFKREDE